MKKPVPNPSQPRILKQGKYLSLMSADGWEFIRRHNCTGIVIILALTDDDKLILVEQYRRPLDKNVIEFPAGLVNDRPGHNRESMMTAARRELFEETGYRAQKMVKLIQGPSSSGSSADQITLVRAYGLRKAGQGGGDASEDIKVFEVPLSEVEAFLARKRKNGILVDPKIYAGLYFLLK